MTRTRWWSSATQKDSLLLLMLSRSKECVLMHLKSCAVAASVANAGIYNRMECGDLDRRPEHYLTKVCFSEIWK